MCRLLENGHILRELYRFSKLCSEKMYCGIYGCNKNVSETEPFFDNQYNRQENKLIIFLQNEMIIRKFSFLFTQFVIIMLL